MMMYRERDGWKTGEEAAGANSIPSCLTIWTKEILHAFVEIVRIEKLDGTFGYGSIFVGMPEMDSSRIEVYQMFEQEDAAE